MKTVGPSGRRNKVKYTAKQRKDYSRAKLDLLATGTTDNTDLMIKQSYIEAREYAYNHPRDYTGVHSFGASCQALTNAKSKSFKKKIAEIRLKNRTLWNSRGTNVSRLTRHELVWEIRAIESMVKRFHSSIDFRIHFDFGRYDDITFHKHRDEMKYTLIIDVDEDKTFEFGSRVTVDGDTIRITIMTHSDDAHIQLDKKGLNVVNVNRVNNVSEKAGRLVFPPNTHDRFVNLQSGPIRIIPTPRG